MPLKPSFEELDYQKTRMGELVLQRRTMLSLKGREVYEVKLGDAYLMSSLFHDSEVALADIALSALDGTGWDIVVGGLGLGYTAAAALKYEQVERLIVVEALAPVIDWHRRGLVPNGKHLTQDGRCVYRHADFFDLARGEGFDPDVKDSQFDAILLDIDHTPEFWLHSSHADLYSEVGLQRSPKASSRYGQTMRRKMGSFDVCRLFSPAPTAGRFNLTTLYSRPSQPMAYTSLAAANQLAVRRKQRGHPS
ncbi:MAG: spermidine synthase [Desulfobacteraceae bacterium]